MTQHACDCQQFSISKHQPTVSLARSFQRNVVMIHPVHSGTRASYKPSKSSLKPQAESTSLRSVDEILSMFSTKLLNEPTSQAHIL